MRENRYVLHYADDSLLFVAFRLNEEQGVGKRVAVAADLDELVDKCKRLGLKLHAVTTAAEKTLHHFLTISEPVAQFLEQQYPDHVERRQTKGGMKRRLDVEGGDEEYYS